MSRGLNTSYSGSMYNSEIKPLDYLYGPWSSLDELLLEMHVSEDEIEPCITVGIMEDDRVVEYWNPVAGGGFVRKVEGGLRSSVETWSEALELTRVTGSVGSMVFVKTPEVDEETGVVTHQSGLYLIEGEDNLRLVGSDIKYGVFPESEDMDADEVKPMVTDGVAKVSDVYRRLKKHQLESNRRLRYDDVRINAMTSQLDRYDEHDEDDRDNHMFIQRVEINPNYVQGDFDNDVTSDDFSNGVGVIVLKREALDTDRILMCGDNKDPETGNMILDGDFLTVQGVNIGNYKSGDKISNGDTLKDILTNLLVKELMPQGEVKNPYCVLRRVDNTDARSEDEVYAAGSVSGFQFECEYHDGEIPTFDANGNDTKVESYYVPAGCVADETLVKYYVKRPGDTDYSEIGDVSAMPTDMSDEFTEYLIPGEYRFHTEIPYSSCTSKSYTNLGNVVVNEGGDSVLIPAGIAVSDDIVITVKTKSYSYTGVKKDELHGIEKVFTDDDVNGLDETWLEDLSVDSLTLKSGEGAYYLIPGGYNIVFDTQIVKGVSAVEGGRYTYSRPDGTDVTYVMYYMLNPGTYENIRYVENPDWGTDF